MRERDHLEDPTVRGRLLSEWILNLLVWIDMVQDRGKLWAVVNVVMNPWVL
jgi:hypothetical protein